MKTIEEQTIEIDRWKKAERDLTEFEEMMELISKYPVKIAKLPPPCPPYEPTNSSSYDF